MRKIANTVLMVISLLLILGLMLAIAQEQQRPERRGEASSLSREEISRLVEIIRIWKLVDELGLKEEQLVEFLPRFKELREIRSRFYRGRRSHVSELGKLLEADAPDEQLKSKMDEFRNTETEYYYKYRELQDALNSDLTIEQQAKYVVFEDKYRADMRRVITTLRELSEQREPQQED